ncbi:hypothetical protein C7446_0739 [Kushneria sinocarnis]|uniref:DUF3892 domain-containing protein n=2 Tax=Kushneria sinocarnis TaxID=595502 RepID=A0A420WZN8_9GAMM|nr:hypothetical protein C7446_0739 [Kushneria sinocarnis]
MHYRRVMATGCDPRGRITRLCNFSTGWVLVTATQAIREIETGRCQYYIQDDCGSSDLIVTRDREGCQLQVDPAGASRITLVNLLNC